jgi:pimeloyl-ACP methyl ester carboxylesterase
MKTTLVRQPTDDKLLLQGLLHEPESSSQKAILFVHGVTGNFYQDRFLDAMAKQFTNEGYAFLTGNNRGHDFISMIPVAETKDQYKKIGSAFEKFEDCVHDIKAWIDLLQSRGYQEIYLVGHSLGSSKVAYYLAKASDFRVKKIIFMAPVPIIDIFVSDKEHPKLLEEANKMIEQGRGEELMQSKVLGWIYMCPQTYLQYGTVGGPMDIFNTKKVNFESPLSKITVPVYAFWGTNDYLGPLISLKISLEVLKKEASNTFVETELVEGPGHSFEGFEEEVAQKLLNWIKS